MLVSSCDSQSLVSIKLLPLVTPSESAVQEAREILAAMVAAKAAGQGAATYKGRLIDIASMRQAEVIVGRAGVVEG